MPMLIIDIELKILPLYLYENKRLCIQNWKNGSGVPMTLNECSFILLGSSEHTIDFSFSITCTPWLQCISWSGSNQSSKYPFI